MKPLTDVTKADVCAATVAMSPADGLEDSPLTVLSKESNEDLIALVSFGKSFCADLTNCVEFVLILFSWASSPLIPLLNVRPVRPLTELSKFERSEQYAGLLLPPQPATTKQMTAARAIPDSRRVTPRCPADMYLSSRTTAA